MQEIDPDRPRPTPGHVLELLAHRHRRAVLHRLACDGPVPLRALARHIVEVDPGTALDHVVVDLHHVHLPKLDDAGLARFDPEAGVASSVGPRTRHAADIAAAVARWPAVGREA